MENITLDWLGSIIYLLPIAALIWKASSLSSKVKANEEKIKEIRSITDRQNEAILEFLRDKERELNTEVK